MATPRSRRRFLVGTGLVSALALGAGVVAGAVHSPSVPSAQPAAAAQILTTSIPDVVPVPSVPPVPEVTTTTAAVEIGEGSTAVAVSSQPAPTIAVPQWVRFQDQDCQCGAEFPWTVRASSSESANGTTRLLLSERTDSTLSAAIFTSAPPAADENINDHMGALLNALAGDAGRLSNIRTSTGPGSSTALSAELHQGSGMSGVQVFVAGEHSYVLLLGVANGSIPAGTLERFQSSFSLL